MEGWWMMDGRWWMDEYWLEGMKKEGFVEC